MSKVIDRFHCQANKKQIGNRPVEEAKKMKCFKRLIYKKSQVFMTHSFGIICRNFSCIFVKLCMETPYWCTVLVHQYGRRKSTKQLEFTFSLKVLSVHSRTSIRAHKHIFQYLKWYGYTAENQEETFFNETATRQHSYFGVTHCEN